MYAIIIIFIDLYPSQPPLHSIPHFKQSRTFKMLANNIIATFVLGLAATVSAANNKANEYKSGDW